MIGYLLAQAKQYYTMGLQNRRRPLRVVYTGVGRFVRPIPKPEVWPPRPHEPNFATDGMRLNVLLPSIKTTKGMAEELPNGSLRLKLPFCIPFPSSADSHVSDDFGNGQGIDISDDDIPEGLVYSDNDDDSNEADPVPAKQKFGAQVISSFMACFTHSNTVFWANTLCFL